MMKVKKILPIAAFCGALAVVLGAFGAHALKDYLLQFEDSELRKTWWDLASKYHFWHTFLLMGIAFFAMQRQDSEKVLKQLKKAFIAGLIGITLFSGSLYLMTITGMKILGAITPLGGTALIVSWILLALAALKGEE